jgi:hypothetical protein
MTLILAFVAAHIGNFAIGFVGVVGAVLAWFHGRSTVKAQAADQVKAAQTEVQVAQLDAVAAKADKEQAQAETVAVKVAAKAQSDATSMTDAQLDDAAAKLGILKE